MAVKNEFFLLKGYIRLKRRQNLRAPSAKTIKQITERCRMTINVIDSGSFIKLGKEQSIDAVVLISNKKGLPITEEEYSRNKLFVNAYHVTCAHGYLEGVIMTKWGIVVLSSRIETVKWILNEKVIYTSPNKVRSRYMNDSWVKSGRSNRHIDKNVYYITEESDLFELTMDTNLLKKEGQVERKIHSSPKMIDIWPDAERVYCLSEDGQLDIVRIKPHSSKPILIQRKFAVIEGETYSAIEGCRSFVVIADYNKSLYSTTLRLLSKEGMALDVLNSYKCNTNFSNTTSNVHRMAITFVKNVPFLLTSHLFKDVCLFMVVKSKTPKLSFLSHASGMTGCVNWTCHALAQTPNRFIIGSESKDSCSLVEIIF